MNADPAELDKFSQLAHRWWDPQGEFRPLHDINPLRLDWIDRHAHLAGKTVLDVGCGGGILSEAMAGLGAEVTGIDLSDQALQVAQLHLLESKANVTYRKVAVEELAREQPASFDVVTCMEVLEHIPQPAEHVRACVSSRRAIVIGTTGFSPSQVDEIRRAAATIAVVMAPNMSVGVNVMMKLVELGSRALGPDYDVEVFEMHHRKKVDAPSGTALKLGEVAAAALAKPDVKEKLASMGFDPVASTPEEFKAWILSEIPRWAKVIRDAKIEVQ